MEKLAFEIFARIEAEEIQKMSIEQVEAELRESGIDAELVVQRIRQRIQHMIDGSITEAR